MKKTLLMTSTAALSAACMATAQADVIAHYSFDSDYSLTAGSYSGTLSEVENLGATVAITTATGESVFGGGAANFTSTETDEAYLDLSSAINFSATDAWSASFWVRRREGSTVRQGMVAGDTSNTTDFIWAADNPSQVEGMRFRNTSNDNANFGGHPDDGEFHHWVVISDGAGTISAYRDNVAQTDVSIGGDLSINAIGQAYNDIRFSMNGQIDELYIFDEAIDANTVNSLFTSNVVPEPGSLALLGLGGLLIARRRRR